MNAVATISVFFIMIFLAAIANDIKLARENWLYVKTIPAPATFHTIVSNNGKSTTFNRNNITAMYRNPETNEFHIEFVGINKLTITDVDEESAKKLVDGITRHKE